MIYADDEAAVASSQKGLQELMKNTVRKKYGMKIDVKKTKVMRMSRKGNSKVHGGPKNWHNFFVCLNCTNY